VFVFSGESSSMDDWYEAEKAGQKADPFLKGRKANTYHLVLIIGGH
jgi:hypothetical protein